MAALQVAAFMHQLDLPWPIGCGRTGSSEALSWIFTHTTGAHQAAEMVQHLTTDVSQKPRLANPSNRHVPQSACGILSWFSKLQSEQAHHEH